MADNENGFGELRDLWQENEPEVLKDIDTAKMARKARWVGWRMRAVFGLEVAFGALGVVLCIWIWFQENNLPMKLFCIFGALYCVVATYGIYVARKGAWSGMGSSALALASLELARAKAAIRYAKVNAYMGIGGLPLIALAVWALMTDPEFINHPRRFFVFGIYSGMLLGLIGLWVGTPFYIKKKRREQNELEALVGTLKE